MKINYDIACVTAFRNEFKNSTPRTLDDRPQNLIDADMARSIVNTIDKTPYMYSREENELRNRNIKEFLEMKEALKLDVYEDYSKGARMSISSIHESTERHITEMKERQ